MEAVYQEALSIEFYLKNIPFQEQVKLELFYKDIQLKHYYVPDFLCYDKIIVEIKAPKHLIDEDS